MAVLPYMNQPSYDYYLKNLTVAAPAPSAPTIPTAPTVPVILPAIPPATQSGGAWFGAIPPENPEVGWLWVNSGNHGIYTFTDDGIWSQVGTNW